MLFFVCKNHIDTANYENRVLNAFPSVGRTRYVDFSKEFDKYYNDRVPFRNQLIELRNRICYYVFKDTLSDQVVIGKDGWLFLKDKIQGDTIADYNGEHVLSDEELLEIAVNLEKCKEYLQSKGIEFVVMIAPNKARVYSEYLPDYLGEGAAVYPAQQIVDYIRSNTDIKIVYDYNNLMEAKAECELYHKADTHWNNAGAYVGAQSLLSELGTEFPRLQDGQINIELINSDEVDLADMLHMKNDFAKSEIDYSIIGYEDNNATIVQDKFNGVIEYESLADDDRTIYMCRDSFATNMGPYIASQFKRTYMRHYDTYTNSDIDSVNPDIFVLESVERTAAYRLSSFDILKD